VQHWWVNQNQTYKHEVSGGYLWSPKVKSNGSRNRFYDAMTEEQVGDAVFSFIDGLIKAVGVVSGPCATAPKPTEFGSSGGNWSSEGWYLPVEFTELTSTIRPKDHMARLVSTLPERYSPLQANGNGNQGVYLAPVPEEMAVVLRSLLGGQVEYVVSQAVLTNDSDEVGDVEEERIRKDGSVPEAERLQLIKARVGQGLYRSRVELLEPSCRLTGVGNKRMLRASHIKPWAKSSNAEKLDGANGLMLSPHVDHLFDKGFISFDDAGGLLISPAIPAGLFEAWGLALRGSGRALEPKQAEYMAFHRANVLRT
jgi:hypothetical protein